MAETKDSEEPTLPWKRKPELGCEENENPPNKTQKLQALNNNSEITDGKTPKSDKETVDSEAQENGEEEEEEDEDDDDDEDEEEDNVDGNGEATVDRKGKGILIEAEKGESDDDDDDDASDGGSQSDGDSDLSDDPLAEVDLDNILPSRTRRKVIQPGEYIANDIANDEDSDSDDEDA